MSKTTGKTKICSDPECPHGLDPQPVENFRKNHKSPDGYLNTCNACMRRKIRAGHLKKRAKQQAEAELARLPKDPGPDVYKEAEREAHRMGQKMMGKGEAKPINYLALEIDFSKNTELLDRLKELAQEELRTLDNQILYMLIKSIEYKWPVANTWA